MNLKTWKSGRHYAGSASDLSLVEPVDPELLHSVNQVKRFRHICSYCMKHKRTCPVCAGVI